jgi:hypothetical protein
MQYVKDGKLTAQGRVLVPSWAGTSQARKTWATGALEALGSNPSRNTVAKWAKDTATSPTQATNLRKLLLDADGFYPYVWEQQRKIAHDEAPNGNALIHVWTDEIGVVASGYHKLLVRLYREMGTLHLSQDAVMTWLKAFDVLPPTKATYKGYLFGVNGFYPWANRRCINLSLFNCDPTTRVADTADEATTEPKLPSLGDLMEQAFALMPSIRFCVERFVKDFDKVAPCNDALPDRECLPDGVPCNHVAGWINWLDLTGNGNRLKLFPKEIVDKALIFNAEARNYVRSAMDVAEAKANPEAEMDGLLDEWFLTTLGWPKDEVPASTREIRRPHIIPFMGFLHLKGLGDKYKIFPSALKPENIIKVRVRLWAREHKESVSPYIMEQIVTSVLLKRPPHNKQCYRILTDLKLMEQTESVPATPDKPPSKWRDKATAWFRDILKWDRVPNDLDDMNEGNRLEFLVYLLLTGETDMLVASSLLEEAQNADKAIKDTVKACLWLHKEGLPIEGTHLAQILAGINGGYVNSPILQRCVSELTREEILTNIRKAAPAQHTDRVSKWEKDHGVTIPEAIKKKVVLALIVQAQAPDEFQEDAYPFLWTEARFLFGAITAEADLWEKALEDALVHAAREGDLTDSQINKPHGAAGDETDPIKRFLLLSNIKADGTPKYQVSFKPVIAKA